MSNSISDFKNAFNGGTRANRFQVSATWPSGVSVDNDDTTFKVFSANLPKSEVGTINVPYRGRLLNFAGDRVYGSWTLGVYDDGNANNLWRAFNKWKDLLDSHDKHLVDSSDFDYSGLQKTWTLNQLNLNGANLRVIQLINCWPSQISNLDLDMAKADQSVFSVVMTFDYYNIQTGL
jgi:hypothetical protein